MSPFSAERHPPSHNAHPTRMTAPFPIISVLAGGGSSPQGIRDFLFQLLFEIPLIWKTEIRMGGGHRGSFFQLLSGTPLYLRKKGRNKNGRGRERVGIYSKKLTGGRGKKEGLKKKS